MQPRPGLAPEISAQVASLQSLILCSGQPQSKPARDPLPTLNSEEALIAILKKRLGLDASLHEILQVLSLNLFEKTPILQAFGLMPSQNKSTPISNQLNLLDL
jgi:hypothetical protein